MKHVKFFSLLFMLSFILCMTIANGHSPQVTPEIVEIGKDFVTVQWNNVGGEYTYSILVSIDDSEDDSFKNPAISIDNIIDTVCTVDNLLSDTFHKLIVRSVGGNKSPNQSFPPLRFKTD